MELNTGGLYTKVIEIRDDIASVMKFLKKESGEYRFAKSTLKALNEALDDCKKDLKRKDTQNG